MKLFESYSLNLFVVELLTSKFSSEDAGMDGLLRKS